jgi:hypothetical protein
MADHHELRQPVTFVSGWKKKAEKLRMIILSCDLDQPISPEMAESFDLMRKVRKGQIDLEEFRRAEAKLQPHLKPWEGLWEPFSDMRGEPQSFYGWAIEAAMCQLNDHNWWLVRAERMVRGADTLPGKDVAMLGKVIEVLGGHIEHDALSVGELEDNALEGVPFLWTWFNQAPLYEVQVSALRKDIRVVPRGAPESDGYIKMKNVIPA